ncbi:MAG: glycosyltransferase [Clostridia bacterium]
MKIVFLSLLYEKSMEEHLLTESKIGLPGAVNTFQWNLIDGLDLYLQKKGYEMKLINNIPVGPFPFCNKRLLIKFRKWKHFKSNLNNDIDIGAVNLPIIKQFIREKNTYHFLKKEIINKQPIVIFTYDLYLPYLKALNKLNKNFDNLTICPVVTDLPNQYGFKKKEGLIKSYFRKRMGIKQLRLIKGFDKYILISKYMKDVLDVEKKDTLVIEGIASKFNASRWELIKYKTILYTGTLDEVFGIKALIDSFQYIKDNDFRLVICGKGNLESYIYDKSLIDKRICYKGYCTKQEISHLMDTALVMINPRNNEDEYTKYSFPSKTMEYLLSGKPMIGYKLDGIPDEYDSHIYYISGSSSKCIAKKIMEICNKDVNELKHFGDNARNFILKEKGYIKQGEKIGKFIFENNKYL